MRRHAIPNVAIVVGKLLLGDADVVPVDAIRMSEFDRPLCRSRARGPAGDSLRALYRGGLAGGLSESARPAGSCPDRLGLAPAGPFGGSGLGRRLYGGRAPLARRLALRDLVERPLGGRRPRRLFEDVRRAR